MPYKRLSNKQYHHLYYVQKRNKPKDKEIDDLLKSKVNIIESNIIIKISDA